MRRRLLAGPDYFTVPADPAAGPLPSGTHIVRGESPTGALKSAGARRIIPLPDNLAVGPSSRSAKLHPKIRERYWRLEYAAARFDIEGMTSATELLGEEGVARALAHSRARPPIIWATGFWSDLLMAGWLLDSAANRPDDWDGVSLAGDLRATMPLGWLSPEQLFPFGRAAAPVSTPLWRQLVEVWRAFTASTPEHLERLRRTPPPMLPAILDGLGIYASLLPRRVRWAQRLPLGARRSWAAASRRVFDVGIQAGLKPNDSHWSVPYEQVSALARLRAEVMFTVYGAKLETRVAAPRSAKRRKLSVPAKRPTRSRP